MQELQLKTVALLATDGFEDVELTKPMQALISAGATVDFISAEGGQITGKNGTEIEVTKVVGDVSAGDYDALLLPGGVENPDNMRMNEAAVEFVKAFFDHDKPVGAICHAPWLLIEAGVTEGRNVASWPSLQTDIRNSGATWVDEEVVVDGKLVTSRNPDDVPAFSQKLVEMFAAG